MKLVSSIMIIILFTSINIYGFNTGANRALRNSVNRTLRQNNDDSNGPTRHQLDYHPPYNVELIPDEGSIKLNRVYYKVHWEQDELYYTKYSEYSQYFYYACMVHGTTKYHTDTGESAKVPLSKDDVKYDRFRRNYVLEKEFESIEDILNYTPNPINPTTFAVVLLGIMLIIILICMAIMGRY